MLSDADSSEIVKEAASLRNAIDLKRAIDNAYLGLEIGYFPAVSKSFCKYFGVEIPDEPDENGDPLQSELMEQPALQVIQDACDKFPQSFKFGTLNGPFRLKINGIFEDDLHSRKEADLEVWYDAATDSGYGNMKELTTKVDSEVRAAREFTSDQFCVEPEFLEKIEKLWSEHFLPKNVQAKPYKVHLYGPGGHFKAHQDTPETNLVGTFLVGLGDTTSTYNGGNFEIGGKKLRADVGNWTAFHPDVPHQVSELSYGHRAVLAFKMFRTPESIDELQVDLVAQMRHALEDIKRPFGIMLEHEYCMGTQKLSGFDIVLQAAAESSALLETHLLPVVTKFNGERWDIDDYDDTFRSRVYPLSSANVDMILKRNVEDTSRTTEWQRGLKDVPFFTVRPFERSVVEWSKDNPEGSNYTGNEADSAREDSIYLSYALIAKDKSSPKPLAVDVPVESSE